MITLTGIRFNNEFRPSQDLNFLLSCIGEKITVEIDFSFEDVTYATADNTIKLKPTPADVDLINTDGVIWSEDGTAFTDYRVGDTVGVWNGVGFFFYTILVKYSNGLIKTTHAIGPLSYDAGEYVFNATPFAGVRYAWNLIDAGNNYNSLVDGEFQQAEIATADTANAAEQDMDFTGIKSYQIGSVKIKGGGGVSGTAPNFAQQNFTIIHESVITPFFLADQYADLVAGTKPSYFLAANCLNYIAEIAFGKDLNNPNGFQTLEVPVDLSNTGWFNEKFNGGKTNYSITSLVLKDGLIPVDALEFGKDITVEIIVSNTVDTPFSTGNTKFIFGFNYLPEEDTFYQNNGRDQKDNFLFDSKIQTLGSAVVNGDNFGTGMQIIKTLRATIISSSSMKVIAVIRVGADAQAILQEGDYSRYRFNVIVEDHSLDAEVSDKVNLLAQVSEFELNLTNTDLVDGTTFFIAHPYDSVDYGELSITLFPVDDIAANTKFSIDFTGLEDDGILIKEIKPRLVLQHATEAEIVLDEERIDVSGYPLVASLVQNINFSQNRVFKIPDEIRKTITIERDFDSDTGNQYFWILNFPFMCRWEYWEQLIMSNPPAGIFDEDEPLDGLNHFWHRLASVSGWSLRYIVNMQIEQNGVLFEQDVTTATLLTSDFDSSAEWENEGIKTYDPDTNDELTSGGDRYILGYKDVKVVATFEKVSGTVPDVSDLVMSIWIETYENGGISGIRRISSEWELDANSWFKSIDASNKIVIANPSGDIFTGTCLIDYTKLPQNKEFTIYARIYDIAGGCPNFVIADNDGFCIQDNDNVNIERN